MSKDTLKTSILEKWFLENKRDFPWRTNTNPYFVWISEVMLQQTRANVVIPYFLKWISLFPNVKALAKANIQQIIKAWEGLGYYSRARNLHEGAKELQKKFDGKIPSTKKDLLSIKGIGPYTSEAILAFGFHKRASPVDGNVLRVLSRYFLIEKDISKESIKNEIREIEKNLLCKKRPWITAEALIELGALICKKLPLCDICPINKNCKGFQEKKELSLPISSKTISYIQLKRVVFIVEYNDCFFVTKRKQGQIMADLYEMPYLDLKDNFSKIKLEKYLLLKFGFTAVFHQKYKSIKQSYTRFLVDLYPCHFSIKEKKQVNGWEWKKKKLMKQLPFSSGHRKIIENIIFREKR